MPITIFWKKCIGMPICTYVYTSMSRACMCIKCVVLFVKLMFKQITVVSVPTGSYVSDKHSS